jgi:hypothetical protein
MEYLTPDLKFRDLSPELQQIIRSIGKNIGEFVESKSESVNWKTKVSIKNVNVIYYYTDESDDPAEPNLDEEFPQELQQLIHITDTKFMIPLKYILLFNDYYTETFPLFMPTDKYIAIKMADYMNENFKQEEIEWEPENDEYEPSSLVTAEFNFDDLSKYVDFINKVAESLNTDVELFDFEEGTQKIFTNYGGDAYKKMWIEKVYQFLDRIDVSTRQMSESLSELETPPPLSRLMKEYYSPLIGRFEEMLEVYPETKIPDNLYEQEPPDESKFLNRTRIYIEAGDTSFETIGKLRVVESRVMGDDPYKYIYLGEEDEE